MPCRGVKHYRSPRNNVLSIENWFSDWDRVTGIATSSLLFFVIIIVFVRISGKRTTSQMNNFDWIITVAVGSLAASGIMLRDTAISDAVAAIVALFIAQWAVTWAIVRSEVVSKVVKATPTLLMHKGEYIDAAMMKTRVSKAEIDAALRSNGMADCSEADWVILETDGSMTVIPRQDRAIGKASLLDDVSKPGDLPS